MSNQDEKPVNLATDLHLHTPGEPVNITPLPSEHFPIGPFNPFIIANIEIEAKYHALAGALGAPVGDTTTATNDGYMRLYQYGMIAYKQGIGAHAVYGAIYQKYVTLGREEGFLGYPVTDETGTPDGIGRFNRFQYGMIYWTPETGAHEIHGAILALWSSLGYETSPQGYPTSDETAAPDGVGRFNNFQHGSIYWSPQSGALVIPVVQTWDSGYIAFSDSTALGGTCQIVANNNGDWTFSGHMHDSGFDTYDYGVAAVLVTPSGIGYTLSYQGRAEGTSAGLPFGTPRRDDNWTRSGNNPSLRDNWLQVAQAVFKVEVTSQDKLAGGISDLVQQALKDLAQKGIEAGIIALISLL